MTPATLLGPGTRSARVHGLFPYALQRACELEAAFQIFTAKCYVRDEKYWRQRIAGLQVMALHGAVARILAHIPARRLL